MIVFLIQSLLLLAVAFVIGVIVGAMARMVIATDAPAPTTSASGAKPTAVESQAPSANPQSTPAVDKTPEPAVTPAPPDKPMATVAEVASETAQEPKPKPRKPRAAKPKTKSAGAAKKKAEEKPAPVAQEELTGEPDDLKKIKGIGPQNERKLNELGITTYVQIAAWTDKDAEDWGDRLAFPGRIEREDWIAQAKALADAPPPKRKRASTAKSKKA